MFLEGCVGFLLLTQDVHCMSEFEFDNTLPEYRGTAPSSFFKYIQQ